MTGNLSWLIINGLDDILPEASYLQLYYIKSVSDSNLTKHYLPVTFFSIFFIYL